MGVRQCCVEREREVAEEEALGVWLARLEDIDIYREMDSKRTTDGRANGQKRREEKSVN